MSNIAIRTYHSSASSAYSDLNLVLLNAGWVLHDNISSTNKIYKSNGEEGIYPYIYIRVYVSGDNIYFILYLYWDAVTHTGTAKAYNNSVYVTISSGRYVNFVCNKDFFGICENSNYNSVLVGFCNRLFYPEITNTTSLSSLGDNVNLAVSSSSGIIKGQRIQIVGADSEGRDQLQVTDVPDSTHVTVLNLPRDYASGAFLGVTPCPAFIKDRSNNDGQSLCPRNAVGDADLSNLYDMKILKPIDVSYINPDYASYYYFLTPLYVVSYYNNTQDSVIGYIENELIKIGPSSAPGDVFVLNATGTPEQGVVNSATSTSVTTTSKSWTINEWANKRLVIIDGTGAGQTVEIASNTSDTLTLSYSFVTTPDATSTYRIVDSAYRYCSPSGYYLAFLEGDGDI